MSLKYFLRFEVNAVSILHSYANTIQGFAESLQHCIRPQSSVTALYGSFSALKLPYKEVTEFWGVARILKIPVHSCVICLQHWLHWMYVPLQDVLITMNLPTCTYPCVSELTHIPCVGEGVGLSFTYTHGRRNRSGECRTNVCSMVPDRLADAISEVLKSSHALCG